MEGLSSGSVPTLAGSLHQYAPELQDVQTILRHLMTSSVSRTVCMSCHSQGTMLKAKQSTPTYVICPVIVVSTKGVSLCRHACGRAG